MNRFENSWLALSRSLHSISHGHSAQIVLAQSLGSISRGHSLALLTRPTSRDSTVLSSFDRRVVTRPFCRHSTDESSLDRRVVTRPTSLHSTDESSLDRRVLTRPTSPHSTDESSLDSFVVTRPFCRHSAQSVLSQPLHSICAVAWLNISRSLTRSLYSAQIDLSQSLRSPSPRGVDVSIQQQGLAEAYPYLMYPSWLHDESSRKQLARALVVTRLDLSRSLGKDRSRAVTWLNLSRSLTRSPHSTDESSIDRFVVTRPTSHHSTDESSLDRRVVTRSTSRHSIDESSLDRRVITRLMSREERSLAIGRLDLRVAWLDLSRSLARSLYSAQIDLSQSLRSLSPRGVDMSIQQQGLAEAYPYLMYPSWLQDESFRKQLARALAVTRLDLSRSLGADSSLAVTWLDLSRSLTRSPHSTDESLHDRFIVIRPTSRHSTDESSLDRRVVTRPFCRHSTVLSSLRAERSLVIGRLDLRSRLARSLAVTHSFSLLGADQSLAVAQISLSSWS
ncbi:hypothetical protein YC2023_050102 [Brassica napus]